MKTITVTILFLQLFTFGSFYVFEEDYLQNAQQTVNEVNEDRYIIGGPMDQDPKNPIYMQLAVESMQKYLQDNGISVPYKVVSVNKVSTQVVAGSLTRIEFMISPEKTIGDVSQCRSEIWDKPWGDFKEITVNCEIDDNATGNRERTGVPGGIAGVDPNDPKYKQLAIESMQKYLQENRISVPYKVVSVNKVSMQIVAGVIYRIEFIISPETTTDDVRQCRSEIWEKSWVHFNQITVNCQIDKNSANIGFKDGLVDEDPKDPKYKQLAIESMQEYLRVHEISVPYKVVSVNKVSTQVVAGYLTRIEFIISPETTIGDVSQCRSEIWKKPWLHFREITVNCQINNNSAKMGFEGGLVDEDPIDRKYMQLANESMQKYLQEHGISVPYKVVSINNVSTQVVSGSLTRIEFMISPEKTIGDVSQCRSEIWEKRWEDFKEITVNCQINNTSSNMSENKQYIVIGGVVDEDPKDPKYMQLAVESMQQYIQDHEISVPYKVVSVNKVSTQVVAGSLTRIEFVISPETTIGDVSQCRSEIWEKPWLHIKEITVNCQIDNNSANMSIIGNPVDKDRKDPKYMQLAVESMQQYLREHEISVPYKVVLITQVSTQVVAGYLTRIEFIISPETTIGDVSQCRSEIWKKPWLHFREITVNCQINNNSAKMGFEGGLVDEDPIDRKYMQLANESMQKYLQEHEISVPYKVVSVNKVSTQVVAGSLTRIEFMISPETTIGDVSQCRSEIWEKPWEDFKEITVNCQIDNTSANMSEKKQYIVIGGVVEEDPKDPKYMQLAVESMLKYLQENEISVPYIVVSVNNVSTQVVAGYITRIEFVISPETTISDVSQCRSEIWEKPWLHIKEITVNCQIDNNSANMGFERGLVDEDPKDPKYMQLAIESMQKYLQEHRIFVPYKIVLITQVSTQVVAGSLTRIEFLISPEKTIGDVSQCRSEIWEKPWLRFKEITVNCQIDNNSANMGFEHGLVDEDSIDPKYMQLAVESMQQYIQDEGISVPYKVVSVNKVSTQVVAGSLTKIQFVISPETTIGDVSQCRSEIWEKPWLHIKEITVNCQIDNNSANMSIIGNPVDKDRKDPKYMQLAVESMQQYLREHGISVPYKVVLITQVSTQIVAGSLTRIEFLISPETTNFDVSQCRSEIWEKPWLRFKEITVNCKIDNNSTNMGFERGLVDEDPIDPKYMQLAVESMQKYLQEHGISVPYKVVSINNVSTQVVAGSLTRIEFMISPETTIGDVSQCHSEIWEKRWEDFKEITVNCQIDNTSANMSENKQYIVIGGVVDKDPKDPKYMQLAVESMQQYIQDHGISVPYKVVSVNKVSTQVVAGSLTRIEFVISPETGLNGDVRQCRSKAYEKAWLHFKEITVNCQIDNVSDKKQYIIGGLVNEDPKDTKLQLAEESVIYINTLILL